jgi:hypothetical protein
VTSLMTALISDAKYQSKLDEYWKEAVALGDENYFNQSLKLLNGLLVSGNMPNLAAAQSTPASSASNPASSSAANPASSGAVAGSSSSAGQQPVSSSTNALGDFVVRAPQMTLTGRTLQLRAHGPVHIDLISVTGSVLKSFDKNATGSVVVRFSGVPSGLYVVRVKNAGITNLQKIKLD